MSNPIEDSPARPTPQQDNKLARPPLGKIATTLTAAALVGSVSAGRVEAAHSSDSPQSSAYTMHMANGMPSLAQTQDFTIEPFISSEFTSQEYQVGPVAQKFMTEVDLSGLPVTIEGKNVTPEQLRPYKHGIKNSLEYFANLGQTVTREIRVTVVGSHQEFLDELAKNNVRFGGPEGNGITFGNQIILNNAAGIELTGPIANHYRIAHELTHQWQMQLSQGGQGTSLYERAGCWLTEGHAVYTGYGVTAGQIPGYYERMYASGVEKVKAANGSLPSLSDLNTPCSQDMQPQGPYQKGFLAIDALTRRYGDETVAQFWQNLSTAPKEVAFQNTFGMSMTDFEQQFEEQLLAMTRQ